MSNNIIETSVRNSYRFSSNQGNLSTEDLYIIPMDSLKEVYSRLMTEKDALSSHDLFGGGRKSNKEIELEQKITVVQHVAQVRMEEAAAAKEAAKKDALKARLLEIAEAKQFEGYEGMTHEELMAEIENL